MSSRLLRFAADFFLFRSFFSRFWWAFFLLSLGSALVYVFILAHVWVDMVDQRTQRVHQGLAKEVALNLDDLLLPQLRIPQLIAQLAAVEKLSPVFDLYVYRESDSLLVSSRDVVHRKIPTGALKRFIQEKETLGVPLRIDSGILDGSRIRRLRIFSTSVISVAGEPGYLIAVLGGRRLTEAGGFLRESLLMSLGSNLLTGALVVTSLLGTFVLFFLSRRLEAMTAVVMDFQRGEYTRRIADTSSDELGIFARAFDDMAERIVQAMSKLRTQDELRCQLVAEVSHELRRPLATLQLSLETLNTPQTDFDQNDRQGYIEQALGDSQRLARLIRDLFQLSRLDASEPLPNLEPCILEDIVEEVVFSFSQVALRKGVALRWNSTGILPRVLAEAELLECALENLIENALRYTSSGGTIVIRLSVVPNGIRVTIQDDGIGIKPCDLPHIFQRFYRGNASKQVCETGAGLGLSLVKRIVDLHHSTIDVVSAPEMGTAFSFVLHEA